MRRASTDTAARATFRGRLLQRPAGRVLCWAQGPWAGVFGGQTRGGQVTVPAGGLHSLSGPPDALPRLERNDDNDRVCLTGCVED